MTADANERRDAGDAPSPGDSESDTAPAAPAGWDAVLGAADPALQPLLAVLRRAGAPVPFRGNDLGEGLAAVSISPGFAWPAHNLVLLAESGPEVSEALETAGWRVCGPESDARDLLSHLGLPVPAEPTAATPAVDAEDTAASPNETAEGDPAAAEPDPPTPENAQPPDLPLPDRGEKAVAAAESVLPEDVPDLHEEPAASEPDSPLPPPLPEPPPEDASGASAIEAALSSEETGSIEETRSDGAEPGRGTPASVADGALPVPGLPVPDAEVFDRSDDDLVADLAPDALDTFVKADPSDAERLHVGSRCIGTVVSVSESGAIVSFGAKVEGIVPLDDFRDASGGIAVQPGQEIDVQVVRLGSPGAYAVLSHRLAREAGAWQRVRNSRDTKEPIQARIFERVKGGFRADVGVAAFLPGSQLDVRPVKDPNSWVGRTVDVVVIECDRRRSNVVLSRSALMEARRQEQLAETLGKLAVGEPATGVVKNLTDFGAFVDLGGIDGLIKLAELSWGRAGKASDHLQPGQEVTAMVTRIDREKERISLSLRAMKPDPWETVSERYAPGDRVKGRVSSVQDYGVFVELEDCVDGLIHLSEIAWSRHSKAPSKTFAVGAETEAVVLGVSPKERRISLSYRRLVPDPWDLHGDGLEVGQIVAGVVRAMTNYGAFVEIVEGIEGLVHVSDLSWDTRAKNPRDMLRKGQQVNTVILHVDTDNRRLSLGIKQLEPDVWDAYLAEHGAGDVVEGLVKRHAKFGSFVELAPGVDALCHNSNLPKHAERLLANHRYRFEIIDVNGEARRIGLRCDDTEPIPDEADPSEVPQEESEQPED